MINLSKYSYIFVIFGVACYGTVIANDTTHLGHDYSRKVIANKAKESDVNMASKYKSLLKLIKKSHSPGDDEHIAATADIFVDDQKRWLSYRNTHCQLQANVYVYPSTSRMWASQYNSCKLDLNNKRIKFLNDISYEYKN